MNKSGEDEWRGVLLQARSTATETGDRVELSVSGLAASVKGKGEFPIKEEEQEPGTAAVPVEPGQQLIRVLTLVQTEAREKLEGLSVPAELGIWLILLPPLACDTMFHSAVALLIGRAKDAETIEQFVLSL